MELEYQEVFGDYEEPAEGENGQEGAEPAQEPAEPETKPSAEPAEEPKDGGDGPARKEMTPEQRHAAAEARRARMEQAQEAAYQAKIDKIYADLFHGQNSPFTGKPVNTERDYREHLAAKEKAERETALKESGIPEGTLEKIVEDALSKHPAITEAQRAAESAKMEQARAIEQQAKTAIAAELQKITLLDPTVKTLEDIGKLPTAETFNGYVQRGLSLEEAFYLANRKELDAKRQAAARQAAINQTRSKQDLRSGAGDGQAGEGVPPELARQYREFMPDATDDEISKAYRSFQKACH